MAWILLVWNIFGGNKVLKYVTKISKMSVLDFANLVYNYYECKTKPMICNSMPATVMTEPSGNCNLKCKMCVRSAIDYKQQGDIDFDNWKDILEQDFNWWHFHGFIGIGEPMMHPRFCDMIEYLESRNLFKFLTTNGTLLTDSRIKSLVKNNLNRMYISIDSANKENFERIRVGANFDKVCENIKNLRSEIRKRESKMEVIMQSVLLKENAKELSDMVKLAFDLDVKEYRFQDIETKFDVGWSTSEHSYRGNESYFDKYLKEARAVGKRLGVKVTTYNMKPASKVRTSCIAPWNQVYIRWNGLITPCCTTLIDKTYSYGNIFEEKFKDMWNNHKAQTFRKMAVNEQPEQCKGCSCL